MQIFFKIGLFKILCTKNIDTMTIQSEVLWIESVKGSPKISNWCWASVLLIGGIGFLLVGFSSYIGIDLVPVISSKDISFAPQGLVMCFYGTASLFLSSYLWCAIFWNVGSGYNEFDRQERIISIFRWGFPGENRRIRIRCSFQDVQAIRLDTNQNLYSRYTMSLRLKDQQDVPLSQISESLTWKETEEKAAQLAQILRIPIEGI